MTARSRSRVLVLGATGMLGHTLLRELDGAPTVEVFGTARTIEPLVGRLPRRLLERVYGGVDGRLFTRIRAVLDLVRPEVVVNCIGVVKQDPAVGDGANTIALNALLPHLLAEECVPRGVRLVHVSTDCVFSGRRGCYVESDLPDPVDLYGRSKLLGEVAGPGVLTLRTSIIGHELTGSRALVDWFLSQTGVVPGYTRAIFSGITTLELARVLASIILPRRDLSGLYHLAADPISKYELLSMIATEYGWPGRLVPSEEVVVDRSLSGAAFFEATGYGPPTWPQMVGAMHRSGPAGG